MPIDVEFCAVGLHAYGSFEEGVSTVSSEGQEGLDHSINGRVWMDHQYNGRELLIETEDGRFLLVHCQGGTVAWRVGRAKPNHLELRVPPFEETVFFRLPSGEVVPWAWHKVLSGFRGKPFALVVSDSLLFMFWRGGPEYLFCCYRSEGEHYLVLSEC